MSTSSNSLHLSRALPPSSITSRKKRSFSLPSYRKTAATSSSRSDLTNTDDARKAAAWTWYTRGLGDMVVPTKRPTQPPTVHPDHHHPSLLIPNMQNASSDAAPASPPDPTNSRPRVASRFKGEAAAARITRNSNSASTAAAAVSPLYDDVELSGLRSHMADFLQKLQQKHKSKPQYSQAPTYNKQYSPAPGAPLVSRHGVHLATPLSAFQKFLNKVNFISSIMKRPKKSSRAPAKLPGMHNEAPLQDGIANDDPDDLKYRCHHYIHHHHHHYHYGHSPDEVGTVLGRHRRHSESAAALRPAHIPSLWEAEQEEEDDEVESPIKVFLDSRCRRHSEDFSRRYMQRNAQYSNGHIIDEMAMRAGESAMDPSLQLPRRYSSARLTTPNKIHEPGFGNTMSKGDKDKEGNISSEKNFQEPFHTKGLDEGKKTSHGSGHDGTPRARKHSAENMSRYTMTQKVTNAAQPQRRHSETYDRASVLEYVSDGGHHQKATGTPSPKWRHNYNSDTVSRSERRPLCVREFEDVYRASNVPRRPPLYPK